MGRDYLDPDTASTMGLTIGDVRFNLLQATPIEFFGRLAAVEAHDAIQDRPMTIVPMPQAGR